SCPIILKLQERIRKAYQRGDDILIYGKKDHPEIIALVGNTEGHARVFGSMEDLEKMELPQKATLYSQTTKSLEGFRQAVNYLKEKGVELTVHDTVCRQVHNREDKIAAFCKDHDKIIFIAGRNSSNGKVLFNVCHKNNTNAFFVSSIDDISKEWFLPGEKVGVCGATSTPLWQMQTIKERLSQW
ncbi:MAG: 4-hydroxy-3-methylbut-2-enyl diphosphate reductase, partial [Bacteroidota bacterium]